MPATKHIAGLAGIAALAGLGGVAVSSQAGTTGAPITALAKGNPAAASDALRDTLSPYSELAPDVEAARSVRSQSGKAWTLVPTADGGACYIALGVTGCDKAAGVKAGALSFTVIALPPKAELERQAAERRALVAGGVKNPQIQSKVRTQATRYGVVPDGVSSVRALDAEGGEIAQAPVVNNVYELPLGLEGDAAQVEFVQADGRLAGEHRAY